MRRRLRTAIVVMTAVSVVLAISIPVASAHLRSRSERYNGWRAYAYHRGNRWSTTSTSAATTTQPARQDPVTTAPTTTTSTTTVTVPPAPIPLPPTGDGSSSPPASGGYFSVLPPGSALPSGAECAARVHQSSWEPRHDNDAANHTSVTNTLGSFSQWNSAWNTNYKPRIDGAFQGTTDEIIQWAACKWGWSDELIRAEAVVESTWHQSTIGDNGTSYGLMQVRYLYHPRVQNGCKDCAGSSWPNSQDSTAFNVDLFGAEMRGCYNGMSTYLGNTTGDIWNCIGSWYSGAWKDSGSATYQGWVQNALNNKPWLHWAG